MANEDKWPSSYDFVVISPQSTSNYFNKHYLKDMISYLVNSYKVNANQVYLVGAGSGASSAWDYLAEYQHQVEAVVPISGKGRNATGKAACNIAETRLWAFHATNDPVYNVNNSIIPVEDIRNCNKVKETRLTLFQSSERNVWDSVFDLSGLDKSVQENQDPYNIDIYEWLLDGRYMVINKLPVANAGKDFTIDLPVEAIELNGSESNDTDGEISKYTWTMISGPGGDLTNFNRSVASLTNPVTGVYEFGLKVTDNRGDSSEDIVRVKVNPEPVVEEPTNSPDKTACNCDHVITPEDYFINLMKYPDEMDVQPGDVICLQAGTYPELGLYGFEGTAEKPITFINCGGQVIIEDSPIVGLYMNGNKHFRLTGTGDPDYEYGIVIRGTRKQGLAISTMSTDYELDHLEIYNTGSIGMHLVTRPTCDPASWRENFTMKDVSIHDNYLHDLTEEAFYIGSSKYRTGHKVTCDGEAKYVMPHNTEGVRIYNNRMEHMGKDGFQVSGVVKDCKIYNNTVIDYGKQGIGAHSAGIVIGGGTTGEVYNNIVGQGTGGGIHVFGIGDNHVYNNVVYDAGENGILIGNKTTEDGRYYWVNNNTIVNPAEAGVYVNADERSKNNKVMNNLIVAPGLLSYYADRNPDMAYVYYNKLIDVDLVIDRNVVLSSVEEAGFIDAQGSNFQLTVNSPAIDQGTDLTNLGITNDLLGVSRSNNSTDIQQFSSIATNGKLFDAGAYEFVQTLSNINPVESQQAVITNTYPNPVVNMVNVEYSNINIGMGKLVVMNISGDKVVEKRVSFTETIGTISVDLSSYNLNTGMYYLQVIDGYGVSETTKMYVE